MEDPKPFEKSEPYSLWMMTTSSSSLNEGSGSRFSETCEIVYRSSSASPISTVQEVVSMIVGAEC
jgi:hypothetical protein